MDHLNKLISYRTKQAASQETEKRLDIGHPLKQKPLEIKEEVPRFSTEFEDPMIIQKALEKPHGNIFDDL